VETDLARVLDAAGARASPALETEQLDGWWLRAAEGFTGRANSVLPVASGRMPLAAKLEAVERFYAARGLPAAYLVSPAAAPSDLDTVLAARGYRRTTAVLVQTAALDVSGADALPSRPDRRWLDTWAAGSGRTEAEADIALRILERVTLPQSRRQPSELGDRAKACRRAPRGRGARRLPDGDPPAVTPAGGAAAA
jgi:hypothetical protein